jgi:hypothetical protein
MKKKRLIFIIAGLFFVLIIFSLLVFFGREPTIKNINLPSCGDKKEIFSYYPVDLSIVERLTPQGEFGSMGGHVFPVKHVYTLDKYSPSSYSMELNRPLVEMVAPSNIRITRITKYWDKNRGDEYYIDFKPCEEIKGSFFHMSDISPKLKQEFEKNKDSKKVSEDRGIVLFETTNSYVDIEVKAGEIIGSASVKSTQMFDFNLIDTRILELNFINKERFAKHRAFDLLHEVCPYDYFIPEIKSVLYSKISGYFKSDKKRTVEPLCGEYMQDIPNTAQGVWFFKGTANGELGEENIIEREALHMALGHDAFDPQRPIVSLGLEAVKDLEPLLYFIIPKSEGLVNRDWKDITSNGNIYCSDLVFDDNNLSPAGKSIILQMPTLTTLKIEAINSPCNKGPWNFTEKATEFER